MPHLMNFLYLLILAIISPWLCFKALTIGKYRRGWSARLLGRVTHPRLVADGRPVAWFHGVSVGEIHLLRSLIARFRECFPHWRCVVSTTTDTGHAEACKCFPDLAVIDWPLDFTWAVRAALARVQPSLVVLAEGEVWPNFIRIASAARVPVAIVNGRMSPRSTARFSRFRMLTRPMFARLGLVAAQTEDFRQHYASLGAAHVIATGNIKYDGVQIDRANGRTRAIGELFGVWPGEIVWVAGSTQEPEERRCIEIYARARQCYPRLRLILVPRHPERFDAVAAMLQQSGLPFARRSRLEPGMVPSSGAVILADSMGELSAIWGLANIAFVGGSLDGKRGGQNMIEPAAYGAAVLFGPYTWNFKDTVTNLLSQHGAIQVADGAALEAEVMALLADVGRRDQLGRAARQFVRSQQGATARTTDALAELLDPRKSAAAA